MGFNLKTAALTAVILLAATCGCQTLGEGKGTEQPHPARRGIARVARVVDGDTVILSRGLGSSRLVGVDTPETVKPGTPVECFGPQASAYTNAALHVGRAVRYQLVSEPVDVYGRSLVYIWLADGRFFNAMLVRRGYARPLAIPPNTRYAGLFGRLAKEAAAAGRGLWGGC